MGYYNLKNKYTLELLKLCYGNVNLSNELYTIDLDIDLSIYLKRLKKHIINNTEDLSIENILLEDLVEISLLDNRHETLEEYVNFLDVYLDIEMISDIRYLKFNDKECFKNTLFKGRKISIDQDELLKVNNEIWLLSEHRINNVPNKDCGIFFKNISGLLRIEREEDLIKTLERVVFDSRSYDFVYISNKDNIDLCKELRRIEKFG